MTSKKKKLTGEPVSGKASSAYIKEENIIIIIILEKTRLIFKKGKERLTNARTSPISGGRNSFVFL